MTNTERILCWVLVSTDGSHWWSGRGFRRFGTHLPVLDMPRWGSPTEAKAEAQRLKAAINIDAKPESLRIG